MGIWMIVGAVLAAFASLAGLGWMVSIYNGLVELRNNIDQAWSNIDVLLQQRHDELTKLLAVAKADIKLEAERIQRIDELHQRYLSSADVDDRVSIENELTTNTLALQPILAADPTLNSNQHFQQLTTRISALESEIADRREFYNNSVNLYNIRIQRMPDVFIAALLQCRKRPFLLVPHDRREDAELQLS